MGLLRARAAVLLALAVVMTAAASPGAKVRLRLIGLKVVGELPEVSKWDLVPLLKPGTGFDLPALVHTRSPFAALQLPRRFHAESASGGTIFARRCASCHGPRAEGGIGPSLVRGDLLRGASDWAIFRSVRDGVPGTSMRALGVSFDDTWRVIAHIRSLQRAPLDSGHGDSSAGTPRAPVTTVDLAGADHRDDEWLSYAGGWSGWRHKQLPELTGQTLGTMRLAWAHQLRGDPSISQSTPIAARGLLLVSSAEDVVALSQETGQVVWRYRWELPVDLRLCCLRANRGVAVFGDAVFVGTLDARLLALDLETGRLLWDTRVARVEDGASITAAPLVADGRVVVGVAGGEFDFRGFIDAYDAASGRRLWRFHTIPGPGDPGRESWGAGSVAPAGGGTWVPGAYDPELQLVYWGVGNPSPAYAADVREGSNLHTCSVVALDVRTGTLRWAYQFTPNDAHDWDAAQSPMLTDLDWNGVRRPLILWANRNGFFYVLDRSTGEFLRATPFARQNWNDGFDARGRPSVRASARPSPEGSLVYPGVAGATNWWPPSYSPSLGLVFVPVWEGGGWFFRDPSLGREDGLYTGGRVVPVPGEQAQQSVIALEVATGNIRWRSQLATPRHAARAGGLLSIGSRLVLGSQDKVLFALDARSGQRVWERNLGASIGTAPIVFRAAGKPRLAVTAGSTVFVFDVDDTGPAVAGSFEYGLDGPGALTVPALR
jgi:alcohol dehydrogenase (cytochrome c)